VWDLIQEKFKVLKEDEVDEFLNRLMAPFKQALDYDENSPFKDLPPTLRRRKEYEATGQNPDYVAHKGRVVNEAYLCELAKDDLCEVIIDELERLMEEIESRELRDRMNKQDLISKSWQCLGHWRAHLKMKRLREKWVLWTYNETYLVSTGARMFDLLTWTLVEPFVKTRSIKKGKKVLPGEIPMPRKRKDYLAYSVRKPRGEGFVDVTPHQVCAFAFLRNRDAEMYDNVDHLNSYQWDNVIDNLAHATDPHNRRNRDLRKIILGDHIVTIQGLTYDPGKKGKHAKKPIKVKIGNGPTHCPPANKHDPQPRPWVQRYRLSDVEKATRTVLRFYLHWYTLYPYEATPKPFTGQVRWSKEQAQRHAYGVANIPYPGPNANPSKGKQEDRNVDAGPLARQARDDRMAAIGGDNYIGAGVSSATSRVGVTIRSIATAGE
jgi:hypothetical protein